MTRTVGDVLVNGEAVPAGSASVSVFDIGFQRGYGCFEAMRSYQGVPFRLERHLDRLEKSAESLRIPLRSRTTLTDWCRSVSGRSDGVVRMYVTGGTDMANPGTDNSTVVFMEELPQVPESYALDLVSAPWHADGEQSELSGAKTLSYGPNLAATLAAKDNGFDDAVLVGSGQIVLEGPTFSLGWVCEGAIYTPSLSTSILESVTREAALETAASLGLGIHEGTFQLDSLREADEVFVMSTVREVSPVSRVGGVHYKLGPVTVELRNGFRELVRRETS